MKMISVQSSEFRQPIEDAIANKKQVVVWHQVPASGGLQEWFLINNLSGLDVVISKGKVASAFTAYEWIEVLPLQKVNQSWCNQALAALAHELQNLMLLIQPVVKESIAPVQLTWVGAANDIQGYFEKHDGSTAVVGRISSVSFGEITRGYYPDENGIHKSAPY